MQIHFSTEVQAKLDQMARYTGRRTDELIEDAVVGVFNYLAPVRETPDRSFDDLRAAGCS